MTEVEATKLARLAIASCPSHARQLPASAGDEMARAWAMLLGDLDYALANRALARCLSLSPFLPAVADMRKAARELTSGPRRTGADAWGDAMKLIRTGNSAGPHAGVSDPLVYRLVEALGRRELGQSTNQMADRARFIDAYDQAAATEATEGQAPRQLRAAAMRALPNAASYELPENGEDPDDE